MKPSKVFISMLFLSCLCYAGCEEENPVSSSDCETDLFSCEYSSRSFRMGFSTWPYAPSSGSVSDTYDFLSDHSDIYSEHIDSEIPWNAWINGTALPAEFVNLIESKRSERLTDAELTVSVSLLNSSRSELAPDYDGSIPVYDQLNDIHIEDAYVKHLSYIARQLEPDYLFVAIEVNELLLNAPGKWDGFKQLMSRVRERIKQEFPALRIGESVTLHNYYQPEVSDPQIYVNEIRSYANTLDITGISFYPFFKGLNDASGFQDAFDLLHQTITGPIAFTETSHLSEDLRVEGFNLFIPGNEDEQREYLEILTQNAQEHNYEYLIWWAHRDYDELWDTFPDEVKDLGKLWISTGLINEDGTEKTGFSLWQDIVSVSFEQ